MATNRTAGATLLLGAVAALLACWFWWPALTGESLDSSHAHHLALGKRLAQGYALYRDVWSNQPPLFTWLGSLGLGGSGYDMRIVWGILGLLLTLLLARVQYVWVQRARIAGVQPQLVVLLWVCLMGWCYWQLHWAPQLLILAYLGTACLDLYRLSEYRSTPALRLVGYGVAGGLLICAHLSALWSVLGIGLLVGAYSRQRAQGVISYMGGMLIALVSVVTLLLVKGTLPEALRQLQWAGSTPTVGVGSLRWPIWPALALGLIGMISFRLNPQLRTARFRRIESLLHVLTLVGLLSALAGPGQGWAVILILTVPLSVFGAYGINALPRPWLRGIGVMGCLIPLCLPRLVREVPHLATLVPTAGQTEAGPLPPWFNPNGTSNRPTVWVWGTDVTSVVRGEAVLAMPYSGYRPHSDWEAEPNGQKVPLPAPLPQIYAHWHRERPEWIIDTHGNMNQVLELLPEVKARYRLVAQGETTIYQWVTH